jgi:glutathione synthase/RimK-type ligase-like ATP-grasp enzyme
MQKKIYLVTGKGMFFGQFRKPWITLDISIFQKTLETAGWEVVTCEFNAIANGRIKINDSLVFYTFNQKKEIRSYIRDVIYFLKLQNNIVIPSYDLLKCHENKGFQELYRKQLGLETLNSLYISDISEIETSAVEYPCVLKTIDGSNGTEVFLIHDKKQLLHQIKSLLPGQDLFTALDLFRRKYLRTKKVAKGWPEYDPLEDYYSYKEYMYKTRNFIIQKFIPDLEFDFRVLAVFDHFYITKRHVREGDFRASGAKLFDNNTGDVQNILNFAQTISDRFKHPFLSMDIAVSGEKHYLLEYQALHFGNNVIKLSEGYYQKEKDTWALIRQAPNVNLVLALGLLRFLEKNYPQGAI